MPLFPNFIPGVLVDLLVDLLHATHFWVVGTADVGYIMIENVSDKPVERQFSNLPTDR